MSTGRNNSNSFDKEAFFSHVESNASLYVRRLGEAVAIPSVSSDLANHLSHIQQMMEWTKAHIEKLNGKVTLFSNPASTTDRPLPPILLAEFGDTGGSKTKKTVCVYGHLDVQPASKDDGWDTDPFVLTEKYGKLFGRGSSDDKGPALAWLWTIEAYQKLGMQLPVNVKFIFEGMEVSQKLVKACLNVMQK